AGSPSGVFLGLGPEDYLARGLRRTSAIDLYLATGGSRGTAAGRVAHAFGLEGPALVVDTDRSASLVAVHLACRSLWSGESSLALAGGVNLVLGPELSIAFAQAGMLARDGRTKPFDARADGFVRSDGSGLVVLKPLAAARASGDRVYAVIRGSAVTSAGGRGELLFAPSRAGQEAVLRAAYRDAGLRPGRVQYVEAHGTGTPLGDRVEAEALGAVMGEGRSPGEACAIGSVKSNVGHCEAAAGIAGLIKAVLSLERRMIPATLHCREPHPEIPWHDLPIVVQERLRPWPAGTARAGVSSFGIAGTHAHVVLEQAPDQPRRAVPPAGPAVLTLSAETPQALADLARSHAGVFRSAEPEQMRDAAYTSAVRRSHFAHRLAAAGSSREELAAALEAFSRGESHPDLRTGLASAARGPVFVFSGQGSQWCGMGRELLAAEPVFRAALEACDEALRRHRESSLLDQLAAAELPDDDALVQPVLFALQVALAALWRSWGVEPAAVVGQSLGEVAAAQVAGALGLDDAVRVIHHRSRLAGSVAGKGAMATVELPFAEVERALRGREQRLSVAVVASPESTVISGEPAALEALLEELTERGIESRRIRVDYASHSPRVEPLLGELRRELRGIEPGAASVAICSTVTAAPIDGAALDPEYWTRNLRLPVRFGPAIERLIADGHRHFLEISPHPIACTPVLQVLHHGGREGVALPSLRRSQEERPQMLAALGALHAAGCQVDWKRFYSPPGRVVSLPGYPWQRERYWLDDGDPEDNPSGWQGQTTPSPSGWQGQTTPAVGRTTNRSVEMPQASGVSKFALVCPGTEQGQGVPIAEGGGISSHHQRPDELSQALPLPPLEVALRQRVARLLRLPPDQIPADRPLVALGLDSLTATELEYALARQLGASVPARRLLDGLSIETLVRELANAGEPRTPSPRSPLASAGEHPLSDGQRALWFLHRLAPESSAYHVAFAFRVHSRLDRSALSRALDRLTQRHPALRTTFHASQGEPLERLHDQLTAEFVGEAGCLRKEAFRPF
ncbi:MAG: acyltransferase domain-containing protein, partial [bacterium]|nr:acyltransferase domain-containing protein [bacterium]